MNYFQHDSKTAYEAKSEAQRIAFAPVVFQACRLLRKYGVLEQVHGSGNLVQTLLKHDLVDELWLKTFPIILGTGKRLFGEGTSAAAFTLTESLVAPNGVIFANYKRAGEVKTGTVGA